MITAAVRDCIERSVLCWLATVDVDGCPSVSPKEVFAAADDSRLVIAHIASPGSVRNLRSNPHACASFIDVFVQKGFKLKGRARVIAAADADYASVVGPLRAMTGGVFPIHAVIELTVGAVEPIVAPSYRLFPDRTEADQVAAAMRTYGVVPRSG